MGKLHRHDRKRQRGVSLIEAVVALGVMAFGTMAVLGVQTTLRMNSDTAKQRSEALRIAQEAIETDRSFGALAGYQAVVSSGPDAVAGYGLANTSYTVRRTVVDQQAFAADLAPALPPRRKSLVVDVAWADRTGQAQTLRLSTALNGTEPVLAGSLSIPSEAALTRNPHGRHRAVPLTAVDQGDGTSRFDPPGAGGLGWIFSNTTGFIEKRCATALPESCVEFEGLLLAGYLSFATAAAAQPTGLDSESPPGFAEPAEVEVVQTEPAELAGTVNCYEGVVLGAMAYFCAVPVEASPQPTWSGQAVVVLPAARQFDSDEPANPDRRRVCRYTPVREHLAAPHEIANADHPLHYVGVDESLVQQNFLLIRSGDGGLAYDCPVDGPAGWLNSNTWRHQPAA